MLFMKSTLALFNNNKLIFSICFIMPPAEKPFGHQEIGSFYKTEHHEFQTFGGFELPTFIVLREQPYSIFLFKFVAHKRN